MGFIERSVCFLIRSICGGGGGGGPICHRCRCRRRCPCKQQAGGDGWCVYACVCVVWAISVLGYGDRFNDAIRVVLSLGFFWADGA